MAKVDKSSDVSPEFIRDLTQFDKTAIKSFGCFEDAEEAHRRYWWSRTPTERLIALEYVRQRAWGYNDDTRPRFSRSPELLQLQQREMTDLDSEND